MELGFFDQVGELARTLVPAELGALRFRAHRRGVKVWFDTDKATRFHWEAQLLPRTLVDGTDGTALEVGFHAEHPDEDRNQQVLDALADAEPRWRPELGPEAEAGAFFGSAPDWRRLSETWPEPDLDDPELAFEVASRLADYVTAVEPHLPDRGSRP